MSALYPAFSSNLLPCPCLEHFAEAGCGKTKRCQDWEMPPGSWAICPASRRLLLCCPSQFRGGNITLRQSLTKASTLRFVPSEVYGCRPALRRGTNRLKGADTGLLVFRLWRRMNSTAIGRENLTGESVTAFQFSETFSAHWFWPESFSLITAE